MWKIARITPIFKDGDKIDKSNCHPISVLPVLSIIFQKRVHNQLYKYLEENCFLSAKQSGFRALQSSATCLPKNCKDWYAAMNNGEIIGLDLCFSTFFYSWTPFQYLFVSGPIQSYLTKHQLIIFQACRQLNWIGGEGDTCGKSLGNPCMSTNMCQLIKNCVLK